MAQRVSYFGEPITPEIGRRALELAAKTDNKSVDELRVLLLRHPQLVLHHELEVPGDKNSSTTILYTAARANNVDVVKILMRYGADPNFRVEGGNGSSPMHVACYRGNKRCVEALLSSRYFKYDIHLENRSKEKCLDFFRQDVPTELRDQLKALVQNHADGNASLQPATVAMPPVIWYTGKPSSSSMTGIEQDIDPLPQSIARGLEEALRQQLPFYKDPKSERTFELNMVEVDHSFPGCLVNQAKTLVRYPCRWYYLDERSRWSSFFLETILQLDSSTRSVMKLSVKGRQGLQDYEFDKETMMSTNVGTSQKRSLLRINEDGYGECGESPVWMVNYGQDGMVPIPFESAKGIEASYRAQADEAAFSLYGSRGSTLLEDRVFLTNPTSDVSDGLSFEGKTKDGETIQVIRYQPSVFYLDEPSNLISLTPEDTRDIRMAAAAGHSILRNTHYCFDFEYLTRSDVKTGVETPIVINHLADSTSIRPWLLRGPVGSIEEKFPDVGARLGMALLPRSMAELKAAIASQLTVAGALALVNLLINRYQCTIKGSVIADAIVRNELTFADIDVELPRTLNLQNWLSWVQELKRVLEVECGCTFDTSNGGAWQPITRSSRDPISLVERELGVIVVRIKEPSITLEMIPPWNISYHPPRNVDFSTNNLRLQPLPPTTPTAAIPQRVGLHQSVPLGMSTQRILQQVLAKKTTPSYDVEWGSMGEVEEGNDGEAKDKFVRPRSDIPQHRSIAMEHRMKKMKDKGYRFVEK